LERDVQRKYIANNVVWSSLRAPRQNSPYYNKYLEQHQTHKTTRRSRDLKQTVVVLVPTTCFDKLVKPESPSAICMRPRLFLLRAPPARAPGGPSLARGRAATPPPSSATAGAFSLNQL